jgi:hypothetical protein
MRKCALLLPEIERNRVWKKKGFGDIYEYAAKLAGMGHETVNESLRVLKKIEDKPELLKVVEEKGINIIRPIMSMINEENEKFWAEKARTMGVHTLETYVREIKNSKENIEKNGLHVEAKTFDFPQQEAITILVDNEIAEQLKKLKGQGEWNELMKEFLKLREEKLTAELKEIEQKEIKKIIKKKNKMVATVEQNGDREIGGANLNKKTKITETAISKNELYKAKNHQPSSKIKKYVLHKTNHTCAFPGCTKPAEHLHHTERFGITRRHNPDKIIPLCKEHHELVHDGLVKNEEDGVEKWEIMHESDEHEFDKTSYKYSIDHLVGEHRQKSLL